MFGPFNVGYPELKTHAEAAGLTLDRENKWELIFDFSSKGNENYAQIDPADWSTELLEIPEYQGSEPAALYFDYPLRYGGSTLSDVAPQSTRA